jgi:hypothetical protein
LIKRGLTALLIDSLSRRRDKNDDGDGGGKSDGDGDDGAIAVEPQRSEARGAIDGDDGDDDDDNKTGPIRFGHQPKVMKQRQWPEEWSARSELAVADRHTSLPGERQLARDLLRGVLPPRHCRLRASPRLL